MTPKPLIIYVHIPKTGGSSVINIFHKIYGMERSVRVKNINNQENHNAVEKILLNEPFKYDFILGHLGELDFHNLPVERPFYYFTVLRHPAERVISLYHYIRRSETHHRHELFKQIDNLETALPQLGGNLQTRLISGMPPKHEPTQADLEQAKRNLEMLFLFAGVLERFDETLLLLNQMLGWSRMFIQPPHLNATSRNRSTSDEIYKRTIELNALDMELYEFANDLMNRKIQESGLVFQRDKFKLAFRRSYHQVKLFVKTKIQKS
jgi:hypothetical protein